MVEANKEMMELWQEAEATCAKLYPVAEADVPEELKKEGYKADDLLIDDVDFNMISAIFTELARRDWDRKFTKG